VLGLSQGSVSELLSKPKPWHMLSIKGREPFIRMQLWLNDPHNIEKLQALKSERKDNYLSKRKRGMDSSSDRSSPADSSDMYANPVDSPGSAKKQRVLFSDEQKEALNVAFNLEPYPSTATMDFLSQELNLEARSISNWFHNHRMRLKQHMPQGADQLNLFSGKESQTFDPVKFRLLFHQRMLDVRSDDSGSHGTTEEIGLQATNFSSILRQFGSLHSSIDQLCPKEQRDEKDLVGGGLDLTFKRDNDNDKDSIAESGSDDSNHETSTSINIKQDKNDPESESEDSSMHGRTDLVSTISVSSRSRRKPVAPQWVRPDWMESDDNNDVKEKVVVDDDDESSRRLLPKPATIAGAAVSDKENNLTINGVCVMNSSYAFNKTFDAINKSPVADKQEDKNESIL
jgi:homeobox protein cut-like